MTAEPTSSERAPQESSTSVTRTKDVETVLHQNDESPDDEGGGGGGGLRKNLGAKDLIGFGVGIVIGTGIFTLTGTSAKNFAGPAVVISFLVAGLVSLFAALCYAELAAAVPTAGSSYTTPTRRSARSSPGSSRGT